VRFDKTIREDEKEIFKETVDEFENLFKNKVNFEFYDRKEGSLSFIRLMKNELK
jgi:hypothetical protein